MFALREIHKSGAQSDTQIGENYTFIKRGCQSFDVTIHFAKLFIDDSDMYAVITNNDSTKVIPLYKNRKYYIMSDNGKTYQNVSYKPS